MKKFKIFISLLLSLLILTGCAGVKSDTAEDAGTAEYEVNTLTVNSHHLRYLKFGDGEKSMVILPGLSVYYVTDSAQSIVSGGFSSFTADYTVYLLDVPDEIPKGYTMDDMVSDMKCAIDSLGLTDIYLYGASMGGIEGMYIAGEYPELVCKLAVCSTAFKNNEQSSGVLNTWISLANEKDGTALLKDMAEHIYSKTTQDTYGEALYAGGEDLSDETLLRFARITDALLNADASSKAENITCPVFAVGSEGDEIFGYEETLTIAETLDCDYYIYDSSYGHAVYDEAPDFLDRLYDFFTSGTVGNG